jgi:phenylalanyl-tRNA synthetase alpha chain
MQVTDLLAQVQRLKEEAEQALRNAETMEAVEEVRRRFLGRKGELNAILRSLSQLPPDERRGLVPKPMHCAIGLKKRS